MRHVFQENRHVGYFAIPYSHENEEIMERRFDFVTRLCADWASKTNIPFSPITHTHLLQKEGNLPRDWDFWKIQDGPFLKMADKLYVIDARGVEESTGVQSEIKMFNGEIEMIDPLQTNAMRIIGVSGRKRSGKDVFARILEQKAGFESYALADPIKAAAKEIFLLSDAQVGGDRKEEEDQFWGMTPREIMQVFGTDAFREQFGDDVWIKNLEERLRLWLPRKAVITDLRFPNEVRAIQRLKNGVVVRIDASDRLDYDDDHRSETALEGFDDYDYVIDNNGTLDEFRSKVESFIDSNL